MPEFAGRSYKTVRGSDVDRDGMYLELTDDAGEGVGEAFGRDRRDDPDDL